MLIGYTDTNECNFAVNVLRKRDVKRAVKLIDEGITAWYRAAWDGREPIEPTENYSADEIEGFYGAGYAEPSLWLLEKFNIPHRHVRLNEISDKDVDMWI